MICWYCYWGWSTPVVEIYRRALEAAGMSALHYGPAHIVWDDENFDRESVQWCLDHFHEYCEDYPDAELQVVKDSLTALLALPDAVRDPRPDDYDNEHPAQFPPSVPMEHP